MSDMRTTDTEAKCRYCGWTFKFCSCPAFTPRTKDVLSREEIGELKLFITAHRALAGNRVNDLLYSHEALRAQLATALKAQQKAERERDRWEKAANAHEKIACAIATNRDEIAHELDEARATIQRLTTERDEAVRVMDDATRQNAAQVDRLVAEQRCLEAEKREMREALGLSHEDWMSLSRAFNAVAYRHMSLPAEHRINEYLKARISAALAGSTAAEGTKETKEANDEV